MSICPVCEKGLKHDKNAELIHKDCLDELTDAYYEYHHLDDSEETIVSKVN